MPYAIFAGLKILFPVAGLIALFMFLIPIREWFSRKLNKKGNENE